MNFFLIFSIFVLFLTSCVQQVVEPDFSTELDVQEPKSVVQAELTQKTQVKEPFILANPYGFSLTFPPNWEAVFQSYDRGGYGYMDFESTLPGMPGERISYELHTTSKNYHPFYIQVIPAEFVGDQRIPDVDKLLGVGECHAFFARSFEEEDVFGDTAEILNSFQMLDSECPSQFIQTAY